MGAEKFMNVHETLEYVENFKVYLQRMIYLMMNISSHREGWLFYL